MKPAIILVRPQLGQNIGKAARAMANFGLDDMRVVSPRDGWPNPDAVPAAAGADHILDRARVFASVEDAIADLRVVYATTARPREMVKPVVTPRGAGATMVASLHTGDAAGVLFGAEAAGLSNDETTLAGTIISIPCAPDFRSFNLAQAVLLVAYEWFLAQDGQDRVTAPVEDTPAARAELTGFMGQLEGELDQSGFLRPPEKRPQMVRNIRNIFTRLPMTEQEVRTLRGIVRSLAVYGRSRKP
ncbi:MAG: RNA methyltransferase [Sphingomonadales bacterium]